MKVFRFEKVDSENLDKMKDNEEINTISMVKLRKLKEFNYIIINNPTDSSRVYVINNLRLKLSGKNNKLSVMMGEQCSSNKDILKLDTLNIICDLEDKKEAGHTELATFDLFPNNTADLLGDYYFIILPGGSLLLGMENALKEVEMAINWCAESIYN